ncbi:MAG: putative ABC transporter, partial [Streblomastix strix]
MWTFLHMVHLPVSILIPLIFVFIDFGVTTFVAVGVIVIVMIPQVYFSTRMSAAIKRYLGSNDIRNKITNETIQGMRVVKFSGLESVFIDRIQKTRLPQCWDSFWYTFFVQIVAVFTRFIEPALNAAIIPTYVYANDIPQSEFTVRIMPNLGFIRQMTRETRLIPQYIQAALMILVGLQRIEEFLLLPELKREVHQIPDDAENVALTIERGYFAWGDPIEIPMTVAEREKMKKEMDKRRKQQKIKLYRKKDNGDKNAELNGLLFDGQKHDNEGQQLTKVPHTVFSQQIQASQEPSDTPTPSIPVTPSPSPTIETPFNEQIKEQQKNKQLHLHNINLQLPKGSLTMIIGAVGSGKSSLGSAIIGDIERQSGEVKYDGQIAYCPQTPWINNNTVQGNITFG